MSPKLHLVGEIMKNVSLFSFFSAATNLQPDLPVDAPNLTVDVAFHVCYRMKILPSKHVGCTFKIPVSAVCGLTPCFRLLCL